MKYSVAHIDERRPSSTPRTKWLYSKELNSFQQQFNEAVASIVTHRPVQLRQFAQTTYVTRRT